MIAIGCPVLRRDWVLHAWFDHMKLALDVAHIDESDVTYVFVGDRSVDQSTWAIIDQRAPNGIEVKVSESRTSSQRYWDFPRFKRMAELRNAMLSSVRELEPEYFFSIDSDILIDPAQLVELISVQRDLAYDAVGGKVYLSPTGYKIPNWAKLVGGQLQRRDFNGVMTVDVIMALKLMTPAAYAVDYAAHTQGEDAGWSVQARQAHLRLGWTGRVCSKHIFEPRLLDRVDGRVGW